MIIVILHVVQGGKMNVRGIVQQFLVDNGFDGLYSEKCGCKITDLCPCGEPGLECEPGVKKPCDCDHKYGKCDWHIGAKEVNKVPNSGQKML